MLASSILSNAVSPFHSHIRTLFILKRHFPLRLPRSDEPHKNIFTIKMKTYDTVECTESVAKPPMKLVLTELVEGYGTTGEIVEVPPRLARRNFLLPKKAVYATPENIEWAAQFQGSGVKTIRYSSKTSPILIRYLKGRVFALILSEKNPWTLQKWHVRAHLRSQGLIVSEEAITLPEVIESSSDVFGKDIVINIKINGADDARCRLRFRPAEMLLDPATRLNEVDQPWYVEDSVALLESQADEIKEMHEVVTTIFKERIEAIQNEGIRSVKELNTHDIF